MSIMLLELCKKIETLHEYIEEFKRMRHDILTTEQEDITHTLRLDYLRVVLQIENLVRELQYTFNGISEFQNIFNEVSQEYTDIMTEDQNILSGDNEKIQTT